MATTISILFHGLSMGAGLCGFVYQIKAGKTRNWEKQNIATLAWAMGYLLLAISGLCSK